MIMVNSFYMKKNHHWDISLDQVPIALKIFWLKFKFDGNCQHYAL